MYTKWDKKTKGGDMEYKTLKFEKEEGIGIVTVNRPDVLNALNTLAFFELGEVFKEIEKDDEVRVAIITGAGDKAFVAGADIAELKGIGPKKARDFVTVAKRSFDIIDNLPKPTIAAINGYALGGGLELAMVCDMRIASEKARLGLPEIRIGAIPGAGGTQRLPRFISEAVAKELIFTGDMIDAKRAYELGLVNKVVPHDKVMEEAKALAKKMVEKSGAILALAKASINNGRNVDLETALNYERECFCEVFATEDVVEGMTAFLEKRPPKFKHR